MEVSGTMIRPSIGSRCACAGQKYSFNGKNRGAVRQKAAVAARRWSDESHSLYYASSPRCYSVRDAQMKEVKRIAAFGTELSREFAALYSTGLGLVREEVIGDEIRGEMIKETTDLVLLQLNRKKAKEKGMKKRIKEENAVLKACKALDCSAESSSSSSSSESSDSECDEVAEAKKITRGNTDEVIPETPSVPAPSNEKAEATRMPNLKNDRMSRAGVASCSNGKKPWGKVEVCMGGRCRKAGSGELLQELEKKVGVQGAVIGCKCMGKCRQGPNVRVSNDLGEPAQFMMNPLSP